MVLQARLKILHHGCVSQQVTDGARIIHMSGDDRNCLSVFKANSEEHLEELLVGNKRVLEPDGIVDRAGNWAIAHCHCPRQGSYLLPVFREHGCTIIWPVIETDGHEFYTILAPSFERFQVLVENLQMHGDVTVERSNHVAASTLDISVPLSDVTRDLTHTQLKVLRSAATAGYYDTPRRIHADQLAARMQIARSTYQEHLQKAEAVVMKTFVSLIAEHPALEEHATKGRGRPRSKTRPDQRWINGQQK